MPNVVKGYVNINSTGTAVFLLTAESAADLSEIKFFGANLKIPAGERGHPSSNVM